MLQYVKKFKCQYVGCFKTYIKKNSNFAKINSHRCKFESYLSQFYVSILFFCENKKIEYKLKNNPCLSSYSSNNKMVNVLKAFISIHCVNRNQPNNGLRMQQIYLAFLFCPVSPAKAHSKTQFIYFLPLRFYFQEYKKHKCFFFFFTTQNYTSQKTRDIVDNS